MSDKKYEPVANCDISIDVIVNKWKHYEVYEIAWHNSAAMTFVVFNLFAPLEHITGVVPYAGAG
jgi:hypothetical protein